MLTANQYFSGDGKVSGEKSKFAKTCNRLSTFLKEKGNLSDLGINAKLDVIGNPERSSAPATTTVDLLSNMESPVEKSTKTKESRSHLPQYISLDPLFKPDDCLNETGSSKPVAETESKTEQMTILYGGQVLVFHNVSAEKAKDLMLAASGDSPNNQIQTRVQLASTSNSYCGAFESQHILPGLQANRWDLPIKRRVSFHKFMEKRKDRATVRAPYQLGNPSWTSVASSNHTIDLNL